MQQIYSPGVPGGGVQALDCMSPAAKSENRELCSPTRPNQRATASVAWELLKTYSDLHSSVYPHAWLPGLDYAQALTLPQAFMERPRRVFGLAWALMLLLAALGVACAAAGASTPAPGLGEPSSAMEGAGAVSRGVPGNDHLMD